MSPGRVVWLIACAFGALFWMLVGFFTLGLAWLLVPVCLAMMLLVLIPDRPRPLPPCMHCGALAADHWGGRCPPRPPLGGPPGISAPNL